MTSSKMISCFSSFYPSDLLARPGFWSGPEYVEYLHRFCDHFDLLGRIQCGHRIDAVRPRDPADPSQGFDVIVSTKADGGAWTPASASASSTMHFDFVAICTGTNQSYTIPEWPGKDDFEVGVERRGG